MADNRLKEEREKRGWSQEKLSEAADVPLSSLQKIERRAFSPNVDYALGLAGALGLPVERIFSRTRSRMRLRKAEEPAA
ncbi:hypothetical protein DAETH_48510 (plasmid) [Deinococcus aetherius]|uniref:HTH cro/C1-type domain-containing protein n=1 Tax=Deinococcus aetherius TaxID=200252 RepID=A0ABN6RNL9_9DEIO|nr:helix-turn-helix transcriptional regulator [Deinococcus aetherius]BDP44882.1 hypothetical protein DAETH_48510 [Deinococcus aetherius]